MIYSIFRKEEVVKREDKLRRIATRYFGETELEKIDNLLKKNPGKLGIRIAVARLRGGLDSLEYTESDFSNRKYKKELMKLERLQKRKSRPLTVTFGELLLRATNNRKPA